VIYWPQSFQLTEVLSCPTTREGYLDHVKTTSMQQAPERWAEILKWVAAGEEVQITDQDKIVAKLVPAGVTKPDFVSRAKAKLCPTGAAANGTQEGLPCCRMNARLWRFHWPTVLAWSQRR
jgi:antitoxin (DNA-binding transcriptional repressor) of toxin-antitoxin stability system